MFKKHRLEVRLVKDDARSNTVEHQEAPTRDAVDYALIAEVAAVRLGKKMLVGALTVIVASAVVAVLANAADTALQEAIIKK